MTVRGLSVPQPRSSKALISTTKATDRLAMSACMENESPNNQAMRSTVPRKRKADVSTFLIDPDEMEWLETSKKKKYAERVSWPNSLECSSLYTVLPAQEGYPRVPLMLPYFHNLRFGKISTNPLPNLSWAEGDEVWRNMVAQDGLFPRDTNWLKRHPALDLRMRSVLLDWLMEVCEVHDLHRETFYLAQEYFDRFMSTREGIARNRLQLIGISCLFLAAKLEEVYPPKLYQFAFLTDKACTRDEIRSMELIILKALGWRLNPLTVISWLNVYMQITRQCESEMFLIPQRPWHMYTQVTALLDICVLDVECLQFSSRTLAAAALYHFSDLQLVEKVSGLCREELGSCIKWIIPFAMAIRTVGRPNPTFCREISSDDKHNIQTHMEALQRLDKSHMYKALLEEQREALYMMELGDPAGHTKWKALLEEHAQAPLYMALLGALLGEQVSPAPCVALSEGQQSPHYAALPEGHHVQTQNITVLMEEQSSSDSISNSDLTPPLSEKKRQYNV